MLSRLKAVVLGAVVGTVALMPLYGDPRSAPVAHPEWARMILRALDLNEAAQVSDQASIVFSSLSWRNSLAWRADRYIKGSGVEVVDAEGIRQVVSGTGVGEVVYPVAVVRGGQYRVRLHLSGDPAQPAEADVSPLGEDKAIKEFTVTPAVAPGWVDAGETHLDPGAYKASVLLPPGTTLEWIEVAPPCLNAIEPVGGWRAADITGTDDVAVTVLKAIDAEDELPPAAVPIEITGRDFRVEDTTPLVVMAAAGGLDASGTWLRGTARGIRAVVFVEVPEDGLYTVSAFAEQAVGQAWLADGCRKAVLCPSRAVPAPAPGWRTVMTQEFTAGRHSFTVSLPDGAAIERVRLEKKKDAAADYLATLRRLGFDPGPDGPVTRSKAVDAMNFISQRRIARELELCGDIEVEPEERTMRAGQALAEPVTPGGPGTVGPGGPGAGPGGPGSGPGEVPLTPPLLPPQEPASPIQPGG
jgi:hypothetical protein